MARSNNKNTSVRFERRDLNTRAMAWLAGAIVLTAIMLHVGLYFLYQGLRTGAAEAGHVAKSLEHPEQQPSTQPRLQVDPAIDINRMREEENRKLTTYGWVDSQRGIVHIPIEQAIRLTADRGLASANIATSANSATAPVRQFVLKRK